MFLTFPGILARLSLPMMCIVQVRNRLSHSLDTSCRSILSAIHAHINGLWALKAAFNVIVDFGSSLSKIGPGLWVVEKSVLLVYLDRTCLAQCRQSCRVGGGGVCH